MTNSTIDPKYTHAAAVLEGAMFQTIDSDGELSNELLAIGYDADAGLIAVDKQGVIHSVGKLIECRVFGYSPNTIATARRSFALFQDAQRVARSVWPN